MIITGGCTGTGFSRQVPWGNRPLRTTPNSVTSKAGKVRGQGISRQPAGCFLLQRCFRSNVSLRAAMVWYGLSHTRACDQTIGNCFSLVHVCDSPCSLCAIDPVPVWMSNRTFWVLWLQRKPLRVNPDTVFSKIQVGDCSFSFMCV